MVPHSRCRRIRQSSNTMGDGCMRQRREWDTMAAVVGHLGHDVSKDVVGCCDVCFARKLASEHTPSDHNSRLPSRRLGASTPNRSLLPVHLFGTSWRQLRRRRRRRRRRIRAGGKVFCSMRFLASIDHDGRCHPMAAMRPHSRLLSIQQSTNILGNRLVLLKLEKVIINYVY
jgi:hypothetical protein